MQPNFDILNRVSFLIGTPQAAAQLPQTPALPPFSEPVISFLNQVSRELMQDARSRAYSDVMTFAFWIRKASVHRLKERFQRSGILLGKGVAFHIAPSNVPVNFAYSLVSGLLCGNANIVRVPGKAFVQVQIIADAFNKALAACAALKPYVICVRYERDREINDLFSAVADVRIVWGGNNTIAELRRSPLPPRSGEITFADRYSMAVIDSDAYLGIQDKQKVAEDFYNDTFFSDQNACTSPRIVVWTGGSIPQAKELFWDTEHRYAEKKYAFQPIQAVNKLTTCYLAAVHNPGIRMEPCRDNLIVRISVPKASHLLMEHCDNSGYFYEYDCRDILELTSLCNDKRCQTIAYIGDREMLRPLIEAGVRGIDRIVPMGRTMDFDLIWDGYDLPALLTRTVVMI